MDMSDEKAVRVAIKCMEKQARVHLPQHTMFVQGFSHQKHESESYLEIVEAIRTLKKMLIRPLQKGLFDK